MKPTIATRFRCSSPSIDLLQKTLMFSTLILQYLNKLVERKIGDLTTPQAFHTVKVQGFKDNRIKLLAKFACQLPMKVFALVADFLIETGKLPNAPPPAIRTFLLTAKSFAEFAKFVQGLFQRLWVLFLFTRAQCQIRVFHTEVCPNALTCCWQRFEVGVGCCYANPIVTASITLDCHTTNSSMPLAVFMESICHFIKSPLTVTPLAKCKGNAIVFQRPTRFSWIGDRFKLVSLFNFGSTPKFIEKSLIRRVNPFQFLLDRLTRQCVPMRMRRPFQISQVSRHGIVVRLRKPSVLVTLTLPLMEVFMHLPHIVKQVTNAYCIRLFPKRVFIGFHGLSSIKSLTPNEWVGRHVTLRLRSLCLPT